MNFSRIFVIPYTPNELNFPNVPQMSTKFCTLSVNFSNLENDIMPNKVFPYYIRLEVYFFHHFARLYPILRY